MTSTTSASVVNAIRSPEWAWRVVLTILPAMLIVFAVSGAIWGEAGLIERHRLHGQLELAKTELAGLERENQELLRQMRLMDRDPVIAERMVAEELGWGHADATIYRFDESGD